MPQSKITNKIEVSHLSPSIQSVGSVQRHGETRRRTAAAATVSTCMPKQAGAEVVVKEEVALVLVLSNQRQL